MMHKNWVNQQIDRLQKMITRQEQKALKIETSLSELRSGQAELLGTIEALKFSLEVIEKNYKDQQTRGKDGSNKE